MLTPDERQAARQFAEHCSATLKDDERDECLQRAHDAIERLREDFGDDEMACKAARYLAYVMIAIGSTPAVRLGDLLDGSVAAYGFAAGSLAGVYELPERKAKEDGIPMGIHENSTEAADVAESHIGQYL